MGEDEIDLSATHAELKRAEDAIEDAKKTHNEFLRERGLPLLP